MSWTATRETTRIEDIAYSLLGIFDVSMSLIYGEGRRKHLDVLERRSRRIRRVRPLLWPQALDKCGLVSEY
jgi:hypothetical protein